MKCCQLMVRKDTVDWVGTDEMDKMRDEARLLNREVRAVDLPWTEWRRWKMRMEEVEFRTRLIR